MYLKVPPAGLPTYCGAPLYGTHFVGANLTSCTDSGQPGGLCFYAGSRSPAACCELCHAKADCGAFSLRWDDAAHSTGTW